MDIVFCTLRDNKGATGGPGGVLFLLKKYFGKNYNAKKCHYWFNSIKINFRYKHLFNKILFRIKILLHPNAFFVTHDIESGHILALLKKKYLLVYHNQGPIVQEHFNFGVNHTKKEIEYWKNIERSAFTNAQSVHFPSFGAQKMYFENRFASCKFDEVKIGHVLYNTIIPPQDKVNPYKNLESLQFFSLGTLTTAKGQDLLPNFFQSLLTKSQKQISYILVGQGPLKNQLLESFRKLEKTFPHFHFKFHEQLEHKKIMEIHQNSDVYIMSHRISIFDFATLESMASSTAILLSPVGGNLEFNQSGNILFLSLNANENVSNFLAQNISSLKKKNLDVFNKYFSPQAFKKRYEISLNDVGI